MIFDIGKIVYAKSSVQQIAGEIQKIVSIYDEGTTKSGVLDYAFYKGKEDMIQHLLQSRNTINPSKLKYQIEYDPIIRRNFVSKIKDTSDNKYYSKNNHHDFRYVTVNVEYQIDFFFPLTHSILGKQMLVKDSYSGPVFIDSDGYKKI